MLIYFKAVCTYQSTHVVLFGKFGALLISSSISFSIVWKRAKVTFPVVVAHESQSCKHVSINNKAKAPGIWCWNLEYWGAPGIWILRSCWLWLYPVENALKCVSVHEEVMPGNSELSQAFPSGMGLTTNSCWKGTLPFLNLMAMIRCWKASWLKIFL